MVQNKFTNCGYCSYCSKAVNNLKIHKTKCNVSGITDQQLKDVIYNSEKYILTHPDLMLDNSYINASLLFDKVKWASEYVGTMCKDIIQSLYEMNIEVYKTTDNYVWWHKSIVLPVVKCYSNNLYIQLSTHVVKTKTDKVKDKVENRVENKEYKEPIISGNSINTTSDESGVEYSAEGETSNSTSTEQSLQSLYEVMMAMRKEMNIVNNDNSSLRTEMLLMKKSLENIQNGISNNTSIPIDAGVNNTTTSSNKRRGKGKSNSPAQEPIQEPTEPVLTYQVSDIDTWEQVVCSEESIDEIEKKWIELDHRAYFLRRLMKQYPSNQSYVKANELNTNRAIEFKEKYEKLRYYFANTKVFYLTEEDELSTAPPHDLFRATEYGESCLKLTSSWDDFQKKKGAYKSISGGMTTKCLIELKKSALEEENNIRETLEDQRRVKEAFEEEQRKIAAKKAEKEKEMEDTRNKIYELLDSLDELGRKESYLYKPRSREQFKTMNIDQLRTELEVIKDEEAKASTIDYYREEGLFGYTKIVRDNDFYKTGDWDKPKKIVIKYSPPELEYDEEFPDDYDGN